MAKPLEVISSLIDELATTDVDRRKKAKDKLERKMKAPLPAGAARLVLEAATRSFAPLDTYPATPNEALVRGLWDVASEVAPADVEAVYERLDEDSKACAIRLLAESPTRAATEAIARILARGSLPPYKWPVFLPLNRRPRDADVLIPALIDLLPNGSWGEPASHLLFAFGSDELDASHRTRIAAAVSPLVPPLLEELSTAHARDGRRAFWSDAYRDRRRLAGLLLDLLARVGADPAIQERAVAHPEPRVALFGVLGCLRLGRPVTDDAIARVARDPEQREPLLRGLHEHEQLARFPDELWTQASFAEAQLVKWLTFPTELGRAPDEIEQIHVAPQMTDEGPADLYVFKFRVEPPHWGAERGFMLGVAGPYVREHQPTLSGLGWTFSRFEALDDKPLAEHLKLYVR